MTEPRIGGTLDESTHTAEFDLDDEMRELWDIIDDIKKYAQAYAAKHSPTRPIAIKSQSLRQLDSNDLELVRQRLNGTRVNEGRHKVQWNASKRLYYLEPIT